MCASAMQGPHDHCGLPGCSSTACHGPATCNPTCGRQRDRACVERCVLRAARRSGSSRRKRRETPTRFGAQAPTRTNPVRSSDTIGCCAPEASGTCAVPCCAAGSTPTTPQCRLVLVGRSCRHAAGHACCESTPADIAAAPVPPAVGDLARGYGRGLAGLLRVDQGEALVLLA